MADKSPKIPAALRVCLLSIALASTNFIPTVVAQDANNIDRLSDINRDADGDRVSDRVGDTVRIRATVISNPFGAQPGPVFRIYLDDGTDGLMLQTPRSEMLDGIRAGDVALIEGRIEFSSGSTIVVPDSIVVVGTAPLPDPIEVTVADLATERYEGRLIRVSGWLINAQNVELVDGTGSIRIRARRTLLEDADFRRVYFSGSRADVVGVASQYDPSEPHDSGYRIELLSPDGLTLKTDYRPWAWGLGILLLTGFLWWRARTATRKESYARGLLEQVRASQAALKDSEERLRVVVDATSDVIWELDIVSRELNWSSGATELFGIEHEETMRGRTSHLVFVHEDDAVRVGDSLTEAIDGYDEDWAADYRIVRADGGLRYVSDRARILRDEDGSAVRAIGSLVDITERQLAEQRERDLQNNLHHAQRLESLGILSSGIAHDFNNILAAIVGNTDLLREADDLDPDDRAMLDQISASCERGADLTGKMLTYAGRAPTTRRSVNINRLVKDVLSIVGKAASKNVILVSDLDPTDPRVIGDPAQLQQVVMNFVTNAVEALPDERGEVRIQTSVGLVECVAGQPIGCDYKPRNYVTLAVSDTGAGIEHGQVGKIFEPFFTTKSSGRGLGLSAVVGIINSHSGCLFVDSEPGRGTSFTALLPPDTSNREQRSPSQADAVTPISGGRVLIADDEDFICDLVNRALSSMSLTIDICTAGDQALERILAEDAAYDLLVLDMSMPGLNGDEIFARAREAGIDTPVLFISGHGVHDLEQRTDDVANVAILAKPFRLEQLRDSCVRLLARRRAESQASE